MTALDTSPEYINMCRQAKELQEMWKPETGDFYKLPGHFITCIVLKNSLIDMDAIWLPRIDQLIEMFPLGWKAMLQDILNFVKTGDTPSIESECIKAIMYYNHDKSWNGEDWI